jgi:hypothetical protein
MHPRHLRGKGPVSKGGPIRSETVCCGSEVRRVPSVLCCLSRKGKRNAQIMKDHRFPEIIAE